MSSVVRCLIRAEVRGDRHDVFGIRHTGVPEGIGRGSEDGKRNTPRGGDVPWTGPDEYTRCSSLGFGWSCSASRGSMVRLGCSQTSCSRSHWEIVADAGCRLLVVEEDEREGSCSTSLPSLSVVVIPCLGAVFYRSRGERRRWGIVGSARNAEAEQTSDDLSDRRTDQPCRGRTLSASPHATRRAPSTSAPSTP